MLKQMLYLVAVATIATACSVHNPGTTAMKPATQNPEQKQEQQEPSLTRIDNEDTDLHIYKYDGRIYVIGIEETRADFEQHKYLPYTKAILGAGPGGETVIFEVDKNDPEFAEKLKQIYMANIKG